MNSEDKDRFKDYKMVGNYLGTYLGKGEGVRLGESCVISFKDHRKVPGLKGRIKIITNCDAGQKYLELDETGKIVHISIYHTRAQIDPRFVAQRLFWAIEDYLVLDEPGLAYSENEKFNKAMDWGYQIKVATAGGRGSVYDLLHGHVTPAEEDKNLDNVRLLINMESKDYGLILPLAEAVEECLLENEIELGRVRKVIHATGKEAEKDFSGSIIFPWKKLKGASYLTIRENQNQLLMKLAERFGSVTEVEDFLKAQTTNVLKRQSHDQQVRKWGDIDQQLEQLEELGIIKKGLFGPVLTKDGQELREFLVGHKSELEAELRRNIRRAPRGSARFKKTGEDNQTAVTKEYTNRNKVKRITGNSWSGDLAVPETILQAKKSSFLRNDTRLTIRKEDLYEYGKKSAVPMDVCLLIDASYSMKGEKRQAACYLAQHLLLKGRDKVAVVIFQQKCGQVVVPFTRNQAVLARGLRSIVPDGTTPLAGGIVTAVELVKNSRVVNPALILITDGMPNYPLWSFDSEADALEAARKILQINRLRFMCIGVESNKEYMQKLAETGKGKLYVVDYLSRSNLINVVRYDRRSYVSSN